MWIMDADIDMDIELKSQEWAKILVGYNSCNSYNECNIAILALRARMQLL